MFQFLIGTIKTRITRIFKIYYNRFQFLIGTIKTLKKAGIRNGFTRFNSL